MGTSNTKANGGKVNRRELILEISDRLDQDRRQVEDTVAQLVQVVTEQVAKGQKVSLPGFAKFARVDRKARWGRNPQTGEQIRIKASRKCRVTPLATLKEAALTGKAPKPPIAKYKPKKTAATSGAKKTTAKKTTKRGKKKTSARRPTTARRSTSSRRSTSARRKKTTRRR
jgi:DNA-binding protein HU-beta